MSWTPLSPDVGSIVVGASGGLPEEVEASVPSGIPPAGGKGAIGPTGIKRL